MVPFDIIPAAALPTAALHAAFIGAFADYVAGPFRLPLERWAEFTGRQAVALDESRAAVRGEEAIAFALANPRGNRPVWRLATMFHAGAAAAWLAPGRRRLQCKACG